MTADHEIGVALIIDRLHRLYNIMLQYARLCSWHPYGCMQAYERAARRQMLLPHIVSGHYRRQRLCKCGWLVCDVDFVCGSLKDSPIHQDSGLKQGSNVNAKTAANDVHHHTTDNCLCLMTRGQQRSAQIWHPDSANIVYELSTTQTGFTARP